MQKEKIEIIFRRSQLKTEKTKHVKKKISFFTHQGQSKLNQQPAQK